MDIRPINVNHALMAEYGLSAWHINNLLKLAQYLITLPENYGHFSMGEFFSRGGGALMLFNATIMGYDLPAMTTECGTTACAIGHGPAAGIAPGERESWGRYTSRNFTGYNNDIFDQLFASRWASADNTPEGAALRIYYFLEHGKDNSVIEDIITRTKLKRHMQRAYSNFYRGEPV